MHCLNNKRIIPIFAVGVGASSSGSGNGDNSKKIQTTGEVQQVASSIKSFVVEDEVDQILAKESGLIERKKNLQL